MVGEILASPTTCDPRRVYYQGSPDAPIVLRNDNPGTSAVAVGATANAYLLGTGFRTDTVVTLFKDGVTTATVSPVKLSAYGSLEFTIPPAFTTTVGLITIQAKNPQATVGDATPVYVIATPVLSSLSPSSVSVTRANGQFQLTPFTVTVTASDLPDNFALCRESLERDVGGGLAAPASTSGLSRNAAGFSFVVSGIQFSGTHTLWLFCGNVRSNALSLTFNQAP